MKKLTPPRLWIVHRPENKHALVVRRGPSKQVAFFGWNRETNKISPGQWLKGKVYPKRCDLSPDGQHIIYFAFNGKWQTESKGSWTAVSRYPYLKALDFWPKGDAWHGGGLFLSNEKYLLYERHPHEQHTLSGLFEVARGIPDTGGQNNEDLGIYIPKLIRDGWEYEGANGAGKEKSVNQDDDTFHLSKEINMQLKIRKVIHSTLSPPKGKSFYYEEHAMEGIKYKAVDFKDIENLDYYDGKLFWPNEGRLFTAKIMKDLIGEPEMIHDFTDYTFKAVKAPY